MVFLEKNLKNRKFPWKLLKIQVNIKQINRFPGKNHENSLVFLIKSCFSCENRSARSPRPRETLE